MIFQKTIRTIKELHRLKNENRVRIKKQRDELKDSSLFQAKIAQVLKIVNMILDTTPEIKCVNTKTDSNSEAIIDTYMYNKVLANYIIEKNGTEYKLKHQEIDL